MKVSFEDNVCTVRKDDSDPRMGKESTFYYHLAKALSERFNRHFIRKEMSKDGHLVDDHVFYAVDTKKPHGYIYDSDYAMRDVAKAFNSGEPLELIAELDRTIYKENVSNKTRNQGVCL